MNTNPTPDSKDEFDPGPTTQEQHTIIERLVIGLILAWVVLGFGLPSFWSCDPAQRGTFGDQFGAVNSLFAGAAFAGVIYTIWLQRQELKLQRQELRLTRLEMKNATLAQANSASSLANQLEISTLAAELNALTAILTHHHTELVEARKLPWTSSEQYSRRQQEIDRTHALVNASQGRVDDCLAKLRSLANERKS